MALVWLSNVFSLLINQSGEIFDGLTIYMYRLIHMGLHKYFLLSLEFAPRK